MVQQELNYDEADSFLKHWPPLLSKSDQTTVRKAHNWGNAAGVMSFGDEDDVNNTPCIALWGTFITHVNGDAALCCMDTETTHKIGNLTEESIEDCWASDAMNTYREKHLSGSRDEIAMCDGCTVWREDTHVDDSRQA
jgi:radical SAM protein with 4Fe4S-binding SPASM domain